MVVTTQQVEHALEQIKVGRIDSGCAILTYEHTCILFEAEDALHARA